VTQAIAPTWEGNNTNAKQTSAPMQKKQHEKNNARKKNE